METLKKLYDEFGKPEKQVSLEKAVEDNHKILIDRLSKEDRKTVLKIIDDLMLICNYQNKDCFIKGFKLGFMLTTELQTYDTHSAEIDAQCCGYSFMPQEDEENG